MIEATAVNAAGAADGTVGLAPGRYISAPTGHSQIRLIHEAAARAGPFAMRVRLRGSARNRYSGRRSHRGQRHRRGIRTDTNARSPLRVSSVKSNIGHMEAAAFHCALLKVVLMMQRRTFACRFRRAFSCRIRRLTFDHCPMRVQTECEPFPEHPVIMGINSFGFGGANGHCVVREYRPSRPRIWSVPLAPEAGFVIPLSARTPDALAESADRLREMLQAQPLDLYTIAGNLSRRRTHFAARSAFVVRSSAKNSPIRWSRSRRSVFRSAPSGEGERRLLMVFAGQGTQWAGCGRELYRAHPVFRRTIDAIEEEWRTYSETSLREACFESPQAALDECELAQPVTFAIPGARWWRCSRPGVSILTACWATARAKWLRPMHRAHSRSPIRPALVFHRATLQQRVAGSGRMLAIGLDLTGRRGDCWIALDVPFRLGR